MKTEPAKAVHKNAVQLLLGFLDDKRRCHNLNLNKASEISMMHVYAIKTHIIEDKEKNVDYIVVVHQLPTIIISKHS